MSSYLSGKDREEAVGSTICFMEETIVSEFHLPVRFSSNM